MAVLNATPDSFSGDGLAATPEALVARASQALDEGADLLDLGAESTRPGATPVPVDDELARVSAVLPALVAAVQAPLSIDTRRPRVADFALSAGAVVLNDVSGLAEPELADVAAERGAYLVLTHNGWTTGRRGSDIVEDVVSTLLHLAETASVRGVAPNRLVCDPGLGFGKRPEASLRLLRRMAELHARLVPLPLLVGASRKGFIGHVLGLAVDDRLEGSLACATVATLAGASVIRAHDVRPNVRAVRMAWAIRGGETSPM